jgi:transposase
VHATLAKYAVATPDASDLFGREGRRQLAQLLTQLPPHTRCATELLLIQLDLVQAQIVDLEHQLRQTFASTDDLRLLETAPGIGFIVGIVILLEVGDIHRFPNGEHFAAYAGLTPRVSASAGRIRFGRLRPDVNRYLKWAYVEAANAISLNRRRWPTRHVTQVYQRIEQRKGHDKAIGAVARHLAEATYWILHKHEPYREPHSTPAPSTKA